MSISFTMTVSDIEPGDAVVEFMHRLSVAFAVLKGSFAPAGPKPAPALAPIAAAAPVPPDDQQGDGEPEQAPAAPAPTAKKGRPRNADKPKPAPVEPKPEAEDLSGDALLAECRKVCGLMVAHAKFGGESVRAMLAERGAGKIPELSEEKQREFLAEMRAKLDEAEAA